ncbi:MAG: prepilin-type N-terminal cleavage/methylation domain-containing protein [Neomegalonema sp.]|nr:prepilin-type N-terminal cleavage/methylation domain-containing protein [Neomegalonema sp.]
MRHRAGFTLVEMLAALVLLSLIGVMASAGLHRAGMMRGAQLDRQAQAEQEMAALRLVESSLAQARVVRLRKADGTFGRLSFQGDARRLLLLTHASRGGGPAGHALLRLSLSASGDGPGEGSALHYQRIDLPAAHLVSETLLDPKARAQLPAAREARLMMPMALQWRYYGARSAGEVAAWHAAWQGERVPPRLVALFDLRENRPILIAPVAPGLALLCETRPEAYACERLP